MFKQIWTPALWLAAPLSVSALVAASLLEFCQSLCSGLPKIFPCHFLSSHSLSQRPLFQVRGCYKTCGCGLESSDLHYFYYRDFYLLADVIWISGTARSRAEWVFSSLISWAPCTCNIFAESGLWVVRQKSMRKSQVLVPEGPQGHSSFVQTTFLLRAWPSHSVCIGQWHLWSSTAPGSLGWSSHCRVLWAGVYPVTLCDWGWIDSPHIELWCPGFPTSHLHVRFMFLPFLCFCLHNSFFCCSLLHWHFWRNQSSYVVLKFRANSLTVLLSQKLVATGHWILLRNHWILKQKLPHSKQGVYLQLRGHRNHWWRRTSFPSE